MMDKSGPCQCNITVTIDKQVICQKFQVAGQLKVMTANGKQAIWHNTGSFKWKRYSLENNMVS